MLILLKFALTAMVFVFTRTIAKSVMRNMKYLFSILAFTMLASCGQVETKSESKAHAKLDVEDVLQLKDTTVTFLWRDMKYDSSLSDTFNSIFLNQNYLNSISDSEKAALGYVATFVGNECWWDGEANPDRSNLDCKIITALGLGYQCSDQHLDFLRKWFSTDKQVLSELEKDHCPTTPYTSTFQNSFDEITIKTKGDSVKIEYKVSAVNLREHLSSHWTESAHFTVSNNSVQLIKKHKSEVEQERMIMTED